MATTSQTQAQAPEHRRYNSHVNEDPQNGAFPTVFQVDRNVPLNATNDATKGSNWFDETTKIGPTQASTNVRTTTVTDFAPDVCKDCKTTGWCGFGDSCKFLHGQGD